ncbi:uncharacterized protein ARMOST_20101 [Armillaria ostoyae]|uniref:Uncharacterized protein n=1 Tax=Armillaria ostoyae TaxID=47428 RepID=A0A284S6E8_ARMOS|nr:uncharacterized protein ARMOST_20101 [Armillaria ostoyae]
MPGPQCCVASHDVTERKRSHITPALELNLHIQLMGLDALLLQLIITKAASPTILTCMQHDLQSRPFPILLHPSLLSSLHCQTGVPPLPVLGAAIAYHSAMVLHNAIGKLSAAKLFSSCMAVPKVKQAMEKSLSGKVFMQKAGQSTRNKIKQVHHTWKGFFHSKVKEGNQYHIPETISPESAMPPPGFIPYASYLALSTEGWLGPYAVKNTIHGFVCQVFGIWCREVLQTVTSDVCQQVLAYIDSEDLEEIAPFSTNQCEKFSLSTTDFEIMAHSIFEDTEGLRTAHMMLQVLYALLPQSLSLERPSAIIKSSSHFSTNKALMWCDHKFHVLPNPDNPHSPIILICIKIHLLKGYRKNNATYKEFLLMPETHSHALCPISLIVAMVIEDNIFPHIKSVILLNIRQNFSMNSQLDNLPDRVPVSPYYRSPKGKKTQCHLLLLSVAKVIC